MLLLIINAEENMKKRIETMETAKKALTRI